jgi:hypothetical protein
VSRTYTWSVSIAGEDIPSELFMAAGTIDYGKATRFNGFTGPRAVFDLFNEACGLLDPPDDWPVIAKGDEVLIHVTHDGVTQWRRFTGTVTAVRVTSQGTTVTCSGKVKSYETFTCGSTNAFIPRTPESDDLRAAWLADGASPALDVEGSAGRWVRQIPTNTASAPLLDFLVRLAEDCQARLVEDRLGVPHYRTRNFTLPSILTLVDDSIDRDALEVISEDDIVNSVDIYYGEPRVDTGLQRSWHDEDGTSIGLYGERREEVATDLQWGTGAEGLAAQWIAERNGAWYIPDVPILMATLTEGEADDILDLQEGWPVRVTPLPAGFPAETYDGEVIGFTEIMHREDYRVILHIAPSITVGEEADEAPIYPDEIITGYDDTGTWTDGDDREYRWCAWTTPGESWVTVTHDEAVLCDVLQVAGGGGGGVPTGTISNYAGGGGGGGCPGLQRFPINPGDWPVDIGAGGLADDPATPGGDTVFYGSRMYGGGKGGSAGESDGGNGGSGGGTSNAFGASIGTPGTGIAGMGNAGGHGGGGATTTGGTPVGGDGVDATIAGGTVEYGKGGPSGGSWTSAPNTGQGGRGGSPAEAQTDGDAGTLILQYRIA